MIFLFLASFVLIILTSFWWTEKDIKKYPNASTIKTKLMHFVLLLISINAGFTVGILFHF
jgi:hypothetical protein